MAEMQAESPPTLPRMTAAEFRASGYLAVVNQRVLHPLGLALACDDDANQIVVLDDRDDLEGWHFEVSPDLLGKVAYVEALESVRRPPRARALGYWVQPLSGTHNKMGT